MKGIVFNLLESFICEGWGDETYEEILTLCPLHTTEPFVGPGTYPDEDLFMIATTAAEKLGLPLADALRAFGAYCFPRLAAKFPRFVEKHSELRGFIVSVNDVIHVEVRKLYPDAVTPDFQYADEPDGSLLLRYRSDRKLCALMEGLLAGAADHFGTKIEQHKSSCMHEGAATCDYRLFIEKSAERVA